MELSRTRPPYTIPSYSLTGDLLAYLNCGLQYRYQNRGALPPSTPVQLWFGEFIHAVMEESYLRWEHTPSLQSFPWDWETIIRPIELEIFRRLRAAGLVAPFNLFCPAVATSSTPRCTCSDPSRDRHQLLASRRAEALINTWAAHLFPLISEAEVPIKGIRPMPLQPPRRAEYYEVSGTIDVLGAVQIANAPTGNLLLHHLSADQDTAAAIGAVAGNNYEIILDYKGMRRPPTDSPSWEYFAWQVRTYAWLRSQQAGSAPVLAALLMFVNELEPSGEDINQLQRDLNAGATDITPTARDDALIRTWRRGQPVPPLSTTFREQRSLRVVSVDPSDVQVSLGQFDDVVVDIERAVQAEMAGGTVISAWQSRPSGASYTAPDQRTCTACDHKHYCPLASRVGYGKPPLAP
jgi:PD-(D/E)XK nuclease superfamily